MRLADIKTPALVLDRAALQRNISRMNQRMQRLGAALRPHMKTAKSAKIAGLATGGNFGGITVSTVAEAAYFAAHGYSDITYAVGIVPSKLESFGFAQNRGCRINLLSDSPAMVRAVDERARALGRRFHMFIEIDSGQHRAGVSAESPELIKIGQAIAAAPALELAGVLTHAGQSYRCHTIADIEDVAETERAAVVRAADHLRAAGLPCTTVSAGATPTAVHARSLDGVTEMRPGVYMFNDLGQFGLGGCKIEDIALTVLASVIGHAPERNTLLLDAGALALSKDTGAREFLPDAGYGWVLDAQSKARVGSLRITSLNQEHGIVETGGEPLPYDAVPIGAQIRVYPNHACLTAAPYDRYYVVDGDSGRPDQVIEEWDKLSGW